MRTTLTICDVCDKPITNGIRTVKHRWFSWGMTRWEEDIEHVCDDCWTVMRQAARSAVGETT